MLDCGRNPHRNNQGSLIKNLKFKRIIQSKYEEKRRFGQEK